MTAVAALIQDTFEVPSTGTIESLRVGRCWPGIGGARAEYAVVRNRREVNRTYGRWRLTSVGWRSPTAVHNHPYTSLGAVRTHVVPGAGGNAGTDARRTQIPGR